ncbi:aldehyde dehydrogenase family protein, partial [Aminobacter ciceronei]
MNMTSETAALLERLGVASAAFTGGDLIVRSPVTGDQIGALKSISSAEAEAVIARADAAFKAWRNVPAPKRGELVRLLGE